MSEQEHNSQHALPPSEAKTDADRENLDAEIKERQKITDYEIREFPVSVIVDKFVTGLEEDEAELYIPDYQREFVWSIKQQSRFIESLLLNLPIPYLFVADIGKGKYEGRLEIVDGSQRIRTLVSFMRNNLILSDLEKIKTANGFRFCDLSKPRQLRFQRKTLRMIELTEKADEEARREIFDRLNSGGTLLEKMERRRGSMDGLFTDFIKECSSYNLFRELCPVSEARSSRAEYEELILRYFSYIDHYQEFEKSVDEFLTERLENWNKLISVTPELKTRLLAEFESMLNYVQRNFEYGFRKNSTNNSVPRIRFEAIAVGVTLALRINPNLPDQDPSTWLSSKEFMIHTRSDASNSRPKVRNRIHFVRDSLLGREIEIEPRRKKLSSLTVEDL